MLTYGTDYYSMETGFDKRFKIEHVILLFRSRMVQVNLITTSVRVI